MQNNQIRVAPQDVVTHEAKARAKRLEEKAQMNVETILRSSLRSKGAIQIKVESFETDGITAKVKASYIFGNDNKIGEFVFGKDKLHNWAIKGLDASMETAEVVFKPIVEAKENEVVDVIEFDLGIIKAIQHGNAFRIEYPLIGKIGELTKQEINEANIKLLCALVTAEMGVEPKFVGKYNVQFLEEDYLVDGPSAPEIKSSDITMQAKNNIGAMQKVQFEDKFAGMRENFEKVIKIKASALLKEKLFSWKAGAPKITEVNTFIEMKDGVYVGNIIAKVQIKDELLTFALPIVNGKLNVTKEIMKYKLDAERFKDLVKAELDLRLKEKLEHDLTIVCMDEQQQRTDAIEQMNKLKGTRVSEAQKSVSIAKINLENVKVGNILNLSSGKYRVEEGDNPSLWNLVLVSETATV